MNQGARTWYLCYHSTKLPVTTFVHLDDVYEPTPESLRLTDITDGLPNANSTFIEPSLYSGTSPYISQTPMVNNSLQEGTPRSPKGGTVYSGCPPEGCSMSHDVGHISHIPRIPPTQITFTIPSVMDKSTVTMYDQEEDLFGMIKLRNNDVCYTSGTIEWVGRKRSYPINSGFKLMTEQNGDQCQMKKMKKVNETFTHEVNRFKECDCGDVLPTVNAIVDHLNALHEAVDLVDLRLNTLEDAVTNNGN